MKTSLKTLAFTACFTLVLCSSCYFPGSDQAKIKSATTEYVKAHLNEGEKYQYGYLERKHGCFVDNKDCKYAEVHYQIITESGDTLDKMLYLLMSEHCDSVYDIAEKQDKEWNSKQRPSAEEVKNLIIEALKK